MRKTALAVCSAMMILLCGCMYPQRAKPVAETPQPSPTMQTDPDNAALQNETMEGTAFCNLINGGYTVAHGGFIYYRNNHIYRMNPADKTAVKVTDKVGSHLQISGNSLFFINEAANPDAVDDHSLFRISLSGDSWYQYPVKCSEYNVTQNRIFFIGYEDENIYSMRHDGSNVVRLTDNGRCTNLMVHRNRIYYVDWAAVQAQTGVPSLVSMSVSSPSARQELRKGCYQAAVVNDRIFFSSYFSQGGSDSGLFCIDPDGKNLMRVTSLDIEAFCVFGERIYFSRAMSAHEENQGLYVMAADGSGMKRLNREYWFENINAYENLIFFGQYDGDYWRTYMIDSSGKNVRNMLELQPND
jgi:hypothetical protein